MWPAAPSTNFNQALGLVQRINHANSVQFLDWRNRAPIISRNVTDIFQVGELPRFRLAWAFNFLKHACGTIGIVLVSKHWRGADDRDLTSKYETFIDLRNCVVHWCNSGCSLLTQDLVWCKNLANILTMVGSCLQFWRVGTIDLIRSPSRRARCHGDKHQTLNSGRRSWVSHVFGLCR